VCVVIYSGLFLSVELKLCCLRGKRINSQEKVQGNKRDKETIERRRVEDERAGRGLYISVMASRLPR
jgi:hypothetical protein